jgi:hypothetical protein
MAHRFSTRSLPFFTVYYELFYVNGVKMVPLNIASYLTAVSLAFWIQDDANLNGGLVLNTQGPLGVLLGYIFTYRQLCSAKK